MEEKAICSMCNSTECKCSMGGKSYKEEMPKANDSSCGCGHTH